MDRDARDIETELLVIRAQGGDAEALRSLFGLWNDRLTAHAHRLMGPNASMDASDAAQDAWVVIVRRIRRLSDPALFAPWAHRIVAHKCADVARRSVRRRRAREHKPTSSRPADDGSSAELRAAVSRLTPTRRALISMRYGSDMSTQQIALALGLAEGTVKSRLHAARAELRKHLDPEQGE